MNRYETKISYQEQATNVHLLNKIYVPKLI